MITQSIFKNFFFSAFVSLLIIPLHATDFTCTKLDDTHYQLQLTFALEPNDYVYKDYIELSANNPTLQLSEWQSSIDPISKYDSAFKETKKIYNKNFSITVIATTQEPLTTQPSLHFSYLSHNNKKIVQELFPLSQLMPALEEPQLNTAVDTQQSIAAVPQEPTATIKQTPIDKQAPKTVSSYLSNLIENTDSTGMRVLLVLLLGLLLSLTPCVYPMIPITVGILQAQASKSMFKNFLLALSYTTGIATTFAILGLMAAFTGQVFGSILTNPIFVIAIVALLVYLALSLFGLYEMYTPKFLSNSSMGANGTLISAFIFGAASGTVASPCLSPGLVLLLTIVTGLGSKVMGFVLLFAFGIGLSIPLLIIGTFSSSLALLPKSGMWMVEIKKIFAFMMLGMCLYFLNNILPFYLIMAGTTALVFVAGAYYLKSIKRNDSASWKTFKNLLGISLCAFAVFLATKTYESLYSHKQCAENVGWLTNYQNALEEGRTQNKKLFMKVGASFCSICKAIDKEVLNYPAVQEKLQSFVLLKVNGGNSSDEANVALLKNYNVVGFPTLLLIDTDTQTVLQRWGSELYEKPKEDFVAELAQYS